MAEWSMETGETDNEIEYSNDLVEGTTDLSGDYTEMEDTEDVLWDIQDSDSDIAEDIMQDYTDTYESNGYNYQSNDVGQILNASGNLRLEDGIRNNYAQRNVGGEFRHDNDDGGHLIGARFGGSGDLDNLIPQDRSINRGAYKSLENQWARELEDGQEVYVDISPIYHGDSLRPDVIMGHSEVSDHDGTTTDYFSFTNEDLESAEFEIPDDMDLLDAYPNAMDIHEREMK